MDYILCRQCNPKAIGDCKIVAGENVARNNHDSVGAEEEESKGGAED